MTQAMTVQNKKNIRKNRKGFTLIELIVVIAILAILAAIAIPAFTGTLSNARKKTDEATARVIISAVQLYRADIGNTTAEPSVSDLVTGGYLESTPVQQSSDTAFSIDSWDPITVNGGTITYPKP
jgi:prepilin-type N-terminal cleavage/methylation domain-containing protein